MDELDNPNKKELKNRNFFKTIMVNGEEIRVESYTPDVCLWQDEEGDWGFDT